MLARSSIDVLGADALISWHVPDMHVPRVRPRPRPELGMGAPAAAGDAGAVASVDVAVAVAGVNCMAFTLS